MNKCVDSQGKVTFSDQPCPQNTQSSKPGIKPAATGHAVDDVVIASSGAAARGDWEGMRRTSSRPEVFDKTAPGKEREQALALVRLMAPVQVVIVSRELSADGDRAIVLATGMSRSLMTELMEPTKGRIELVRINGQWKVERSEWGPKKW